MGSTVLCVSEHCALCFRAPCSVSESTVLCVSEHRALCLRAPCSVSESTVLWVSEHCALVLRLPCYVSQRLFIIHCMFVEGKSRTVFFFRHSYLRHLSRRLKKL